MNPILKHAILTFSMLLSLTFSFIFFFWAFLYEAMTWNKPLLETFSSWWNWLLFLTFLFLTSYLNSYIKYSSPQQKPLFFKPSKEIPQPLPVEIEEKPEITELKSEEEKKEIPFEQAEEEPKNDKGEVEEEIDLIS